MQRKHLALMTAICLLPLIIVAAGVWIFGLPLGSSAWLGALLIVCFLAHILMMIWMQKDESHSTNHRQPIERKQ